MRLRSMTLLVLLGASAAVALADDAASGAAAVKRLQTLRPDLVVEKVAPSPLPNLVALTLSNGDIVYATTDGKYLLAGDLIEMKDSGLVNLADVERDAKRRELLAAVPASEMAVFPAVGERKAFITVFTDVDCPWCRKFHTEAVPELNKKGVEVRYLAYPRQGLQSEAFTKMVSAWCAADRQDAINKLKRGEAIPAKSCKNPVAREYQLGQRIGVTGTPTIVLEDGSLEAGYVPATELAQRLGIGT